MKSKVKPDIIQRREEAVQNEILKDCKTLQEKESENTLIERIDNPVWSIDFSGKLLEFNRAFVLLFKARFKIEPEPGLDMLNLPFKESLYSWKFLFGHALKGEKQKAEIKVKIKECFKSFDVEAIPTALNNSVACITFILHDISNRKKAETLLFKSRVHYHALIDNIPYLVWLKDSENKFLIVNQSFIDYFNINREISNLNDSEIKIEQQEFWNYICNDDQIISSGIKRTEEKSFKINNEIIWYEIHKKPIYDDECSDLIGISCLARDITSRKTIENILLESEERFRQFAENTSDAFILSSSEAVLYINPAFEKIFGRSIDEAYKHLHIPAEWIHADDRDKIVSYYKSAEFKKTGKFNGQYRVVKINGSIAWVWERCFPVNDNNGNIIRFISVTSDITRQKQLEVDLLKTKTQQQAILDNIPHLAWLKDVEGKYVSVNEAFGKHYQHAKDELVGKTDSEICHPDIAELYAYNDYIVLKTKKQQQFDEFLETSEGTVYSETIKTPIINDEGEVIGITGISRDITYYKRLEQQLRANDDRLKALLQNSTDSITVIDVKGQVLFDSSLFARIKEKPIVEGNYPKFEEIVLEIDKEFIELAIKHVVDNPEIQQKVEFRSKKQNGEVLYFESFLTNHINNSLINGIVVNTRDITERKLSELRESEYQENLIFLENTASEFLSLASSEQIYNYIGQKIYELVPESVVLFSTYDEHSNSLIIQNVTGIEKFEGIINDFLGKSPVHYISQLDDKMNRELLYTSNKLHELKGGLYNVCNRQIDFMVCKALEKLVSLNKAYGMGIKRAGKLLGSIVILTRFDHIIKDTRIVETLVYQASIALQRRKLEKELIASKEKAEESDKLKTAFLANMSHEIRTPVNGIIGFSQLLNTNDLAEDKRKEFVEIIQANADALISLIDDILDVSIIQEGQVKLRNTTININLFLDEVYSSLMAPRYHSKDIKIKIVKALPDDKATLLIDPLRLKQVMNNLISNAYKFTEKGSIEFGYIIIPGFVKFFVKDTGIGIANDKLDSIFRRFNQVDISFTRKYGGSGLGLSISKGLVELMGGEISIVSEPGKGSIFYFTVPGDDIHWKSPEDLAQSANNNPSLLN